LKKIVTVFILAMMHLFFAQSARSQVKHSIKGSVRDSTKVGIPGVHVKLIGTKDTLSVSADSDGKFVFNGVKSDQFEILVRGIGFMSSSSTHSLKADQADLNLDPIVLKPEAVNLNEVVIKGKVTPIKVMKDTVEYNAAAFVVREDDQVEDLLKQLPGLKVDDAGKVTSMGKELTKIRVNGKDFFTGNVKEFMKQLPADLVSKIQVIDDYGDQANFTGIKVGEPRKILNLVTKPGKNRGVFGNVGGNIGTNDRYGAVVNSNFWKDDRQTGVSGNLTNTNNSGGSNQDISGTANMRRLVAKGLTASGTYRVGTNRNENEMQSRSETLLNDGNTIYNTNDTRSLNRSNSHNINLDLNGSLPNNFINASVIGTLADNNAQNFSSSAMKTADMRQDLLNDNKNSGNNPNVSANLNWGKSFGKLRKRMLMMNFSANLNKTRNKEEIMTRTGYYGKQNDPLLKDSIVKDSLLNRLVHTNNRSNGFTAGFTYSEPLTKLNDTVKTKYLDFGYSMNYSHTQNDLRTNVVEPGGQQKFIDSLSNIYASTFVNQNLNVSYRYDAKKLSYNIGMSLQPSTLTGSYEGRSDKINQTTINMAPTLGMRYALSRSQALNFNYNGYTTAPNFEQLQPIADNRNLQSVVIGNPDLKTSLSHNINMDYRIFGTSTGKSFQIGLNFGTVSNQVVSNVVMITDTLNGIKQETRYENANGNYNLGSNYNLSLPFADRKCELSINGNVGFSNTVVFTDNVKNFSKGLNLNQNLRMALNTQSVALSTSVAYNFNGTTYSLPNSNARDIQSINLSMNSRITLAKFLRTMVNVSKTFNSGYAVDATNPLLINAGIETSFLKRKMANISLQANDILNQGNMVSRMVSNNSIIDSSTNRVTRYVVLNISMRLQRFGGGRPMI
jgi:hypothetical protein